MRPQQTPSPVQIMQAEPATAQLAELGTKLKLSQTGSGKKETKERAYTPEDFRSMLARLLRREAGARVIAVAHGTPSAARSLERYAKRIRADPTLLRETGRSQ